MSDHEGYTAEPRTFSRRAAIAAGAAGLGAAGLLALGRSTASAAPFVEDPIVGMRAPSSRLPASGLRNTAARRGVPGFRPKRPLPAGSAMGAIAIDSIGIGDTLREGIDLWVLDQGPGHWAGSAMPGEVGNCIIAGHRVSHTHPFYDIDAIPVGSTMVLSRAGVDHVYVATSRDVVSPTDTHILDPTAERTATIFACHPRGSVSQRFVVSFRHA